MTIVTKSQTVMVRLETGTEKHNVLFVHSAWNEAIEEDRSSHAMRQFAMARADWEEFGKPDMITLTIEIGDMLNESD